MKTLRDVLTLASELSEFYQDRRADFFFNFSGHVNHFHAYIYKSGWDSGKDAEDLFMGYLNKEEEIQQAYWNLKVFITKQQ